MNKLKQHYFNFILCFYIFGCDKSPELIFSKAKDEYNKGNYHQAYISFNKIVNNYDDWERLNEAKEFVENYPMKLFSRAENLRNEKKYNLSIEALSYIVQNYRKSEFAPKSKYLMGDIYSNDLRDNLEAIPQYKYVVDNFPDTKEEPHAQFMIGYIYANVIKDTVQALLHYNIFLEKYSGHELTPSVKFEIDWLGKDINDIPTLKHISS